MSTLGRVSFCSSEDHSHAPIVDLFVSSPQKAAVYVLPKSLGTVKGMAVQGNSNLCFAMHDQYAFAEGCVMHVPAKKRTLCMQRIKHMPQRTAQCMSTLGNAILCTT